VKARRKPKARKKAPAPKKSARRKAATPKRKSRKRRASKKAPLGYTKAGTIRVRKYRKRGTAPKQSAAALMRDRRSEARDIGKCLSPLNPERHESCRLDLERFLTTYMPARYFAPFSEDHRHVIHKIQTAILEGGLFAEAVFRGFGKTEILIGAAMWAALYGHRRFIPLLAASRALAEDRLISSIKAELETNKLMLEDFECVCKPARALEGLTHRCPGQLSDGKPTRIQWSTAAISLPVVDVWQRRADGKAPTKHRPAVSASVVIRAFGLRAGFRGLAHTTPDGETVRPEFVAIDDPQTEESAASPAQCAKREKLITRTVLGLGGHFRRLAGVMCATIIRKGDMADRLLDHELHPEWQGQVLPMVRKWARRHEDLWLGKYASLRRQDLLDEQGGREAAEGEATEFYRQHRAEMDEGCVVAWEHCYSEGELSAIQHAYNALIDKGDAAFAAEYQNQPFDEEGTGDEPPLEPRDVLEKCNGLPAGIAPHGSSLVVASIDVRKPQLHWVVCAFGAGFSGHVLEAGMRPYLVAGTRASGGLEGALTTALNVEIDRLCGRAWSVEGGGELRIGLLLVDSGWKSRTIYTCLRRHKAAAVLTPSKGEGGELDLRTPKTVPARDRGDCWHVMLNRERDARLLTYTTDHWKSFTAERIRTPAGGRGALTLWGENTQARWSLAEQLTSERAHPKQRRTGETFEKWKVLPGRPNHWWDCLVGCHVAAARMGIALDGENRLVPTIGGGYRFKGARNARG